MFRLLIELAAPVFSVLGLAMISCGFTKIGKEAPFRVAIAIMSFCTAIAWGFHLHMNISKFAPVGVIIWLSIGVMHLMMTRRRLG